MNAIARNAGKAIVHKEEEEREDIKGLVWFKYI